jgi:hypothetical protein
MVLLLLAVIAPVARAVPTRMGVTKLNGPIKVDGDISDPAWAGAGSVETFVEYYRGDNIVPPAKTTGRIAYDEQAVYIAFLSEDPRPEEIRAPLVDRDKVLGDQDYVSILIDTLNDRRSGVAFRVNPRGVQTDSVVNDATGEEDFSPDFFYEAVARRTPNGWAAEMRIPLSSLRYPSADPQTWGVILMRNYPRDFRYIMANTPIPKNSGCFLCHASELTGFEGLPGGSHFTIAPYSTANVRDRFTTAGNRELPDGDRSFDSDLGLDFKWAPSTRLTLDATLNPDFSQIEADAPQIEANNRFAFQFPEKRTFFLEGTDLLQTPIRGVYTRSITSPAWGMRATGNLGSNAYTFLLAEDRGGGSVLLPGPQGSEFVPQNFRSRVGIGRLRRSFGDSFAGVMLSTREVEGGGHNRIIGPDFHWQIRPTDRFFGQVLLSDTENPERTDLSEQFDGRASRGHAYRFVFGRDEKKYDVMVQASGISPEFRSDNGFVVQNDFRRFSLWSGSRFYPKNFFSYLRPYMAIERDITFAGDAILRRVFYSGFGFQGRWGSNGWIDLNRFDERVGSTLLTRRFLAFDINAAPRGWLPAVQFDGEIGERIDYAGGRVGNGARLNVSGTTRLTDHWQMELRAGREWVDHHGARLFDAQIEWLKATYTFSSRSLVRAIAQQSTIEREGDTRDRSISLSGLYAYKLNWQTVFFVGYGDSSITGETGSMIPQQRSLFMKVAYAFQR